MVIIICRTCGKHITVPECRKNRRKFCSRKCMGIYNSKNRVGKNSIRWIENKPIITCVNCGKNFTVIPSQAEGRRFCSKKCESEFNVGVNNPFYGKHHTDITKKLMSDNHSQYQKENHPCWIKRAIKICEYCGNEYEVEQRLINISRFCSKQCRYDYDSVNNNGKNNPNWKGGITTERFILYSSREWIKLKKQIFKRDNYECQRCGVTGRQYNKLHVHHIISFENVNTRDDIDNLILLCHKCHSWVHSKKNINGEFISSGVST